MNDSKLMNRAADSIHILAVSMVEKANSGHPGGAMGGVDFVNVPFSEFLAYDSQNPRWGSRDHFFLDPGRMSPILYSVLAFAGKYILDELKQFRQWGSSTSGHPEVNVNRGVENTPDLLGQEHTYAVDTAIAAKSLRIRFDKIINQTVYAYVSDGGIQEEISRGVDRIADTLGLGNLIMFYDSDDVQLSTNTEDVIAENVAMKYGARDWKVIAINGSDPDEIRKTLTGVKAEKGCPALIIGKTTMGKEARRADGTGHEADCATRDAPLGSDAYIDTIKNLGGNPEVPFIIFPEMTELYAKRAEEPKKTIAGRYAAKAEWVEVNSELATRLTELFLGKVPKVDWDAVERKAGGATRAGSATVLGVLVIQVGNMIASSADLSDSDKTDGSPKRTHAFKKGNFNSAFLQVGVSELNMACTYIGMSLYGGTIAAYGTFFVFSDHMEPALHTAALMEQPMKFIWTHDTFCVGENGPTYEPVEQKAQVRLLEKLKNHKGHSSMLILRPADIEETTVAWKLAMENMPTLTALVLSRRDIINLSARTDYPQVAKGAYIIADAGENPDVALVVSGLKVSTLVVGAGLLRKEGVKVCIVSALSKGLFRNQNKEYQESILLAGAKMFGLTAGLPVNLEGLIGSNGKAFGLESFGSPAPYKVPGEKLGFTAESVCSQVRSML